MKKLFLVLLSLIMATGVIMAQDQQRDKDRDRDQDRIQLHEHLLLTDGVLYQVKDQNRTRLENQLTLRNGSF